MANLIIQENGVARTTPALHGEELTIKAPCNCTAVTGVQINGAAFPFYDAMGNRLSTSLFAEGSLIRVMIDTEKVRAYILNHAVTPAQIGTYTKAEMDTKLNKKQDAGSYAPANHNHSGVYAPAYTYGTTDLTEGSSALETGKLHFVYE